MNDDCINWPGRLDRCSYGRASVSGHPEAAHRLAYVEAFGPVPDGLEIDHLCNNRACVNPNHLEAVTHAENSRRRSERQTHCANGHEFTDANTYRRPDTGNRGCRTCRRDAVYRYKGRAS